ncbi:tRNA synthetases class I (C) catalytic domain protein [Mycobacterium xenopi 4042]|uniref:tRNA synthetases class I (C) catalytic domain protein n=1 Tax=Mycobacterium xenopi 4042 TaxID=1299334 RepID=X8BF22_MYCXE|nr:tRNA synthetases class I (C) catalytic domain protein [Mycobacterium xenopi 4042]EUA44342.1 tRNA synthetases class I (C) catalytic domain protein [Mycobacterium xenopi 3993]
MHAGMIGWEGHKMSKSRGNLVLVSTLRGQGIEPPAIRLALLAGHYRADRYWDAQVLDEAIARLHRWRTATALPAGPMPPTPSAGCGDTWPMISIPPKRLPPLMVGLPMRWSTAATTPRRLKR